MEFSFNIKATVYDLVLANIIALIFVFDLLLIFTNFPLFFFTINCLHERLASYFLLKKNFQVDFTHEIFIRIFFHGYLIIKILITF